MRVAHPVLPRGPLRFLLSPTLSAEARTGEVVSPNGSARSRLAEPAAAARKRKMPPFHHRTGQLPGEERSGGVSRRRPPAALAVGGGGGCFVLFAGNSIFGNLHLARMAEKIRHPRRCEPTPRNVIAIRNYLTSRPLHLHRVPGAMPML